MWSDQDLVAVPERGLFRERFGFEDVEGGPREVAVIQRIDEGGLVEDTAASDVDEVGVVGHDLELVGPDETGRLGGQRDGEHHEACVLDSVGKGRCRVNRTNVVGRHRRPPDADDIHAEGVGACSHALAERSKPHDADLLAGEGEGRVPRFPAPLARLLGVPIPMEPASERHHVPEHSFADGVAVNPGTVRHDDSVLLESIERERVDAGLDAVNPGE